MVVYILSLKADLEHVKSLKFRPGADLCLSVRNPLEITQVRERIVVDSSDFEETQSEPSHKHSKHEHAETPCHFALKWDHGSSRSTIRVLTSHDKIEPELSTSGEFVPLLALECDGIEPYDFHPMGGEFVVTNTAGQTFDSTVDLSNGGEWKEFDLGTGSTRISNLQVKIL